MAVALIAELPSVGHARGEPLHDAGGEPVMMFDP
jgi:hypothetical protein